MQQRVIRLVNDLLEPEALAETRRKKLGGTYGWAHELTSPTRKRGVGPHSSLARRAFIEAVSSSIDCDYISPASGPRKPKRQSESASTDQGLLHHA